MLDTARPLPDFRDATNAREPATVLDRLYRPAIIAGIVLGVLVRAYHVLTKDFPVNDGGLFYQMTRELAADGYRLPHTTSYNGIDIPFAYPPLGFYLAALVNRATGIDLLDLFRYLPLLATGLTVVAFFLLARSLLTSRAAVVVAVFVFALIPRTFIWLVMGGGITRSFGLLFAILALTVVHRLYTRRETRALPLALLLCALTVLSHVETGWFLAISIACFFVAFGRHRHGLAASAVLAGGTLLLTAPWWGTVLARHGLDPFLAAQATGGSIFSDAATRDYIVRSLLGMVATSEPFFPLLGTLGLVGVLAALAARRYLLPAWWLVVILLEARAFPTFVSVPVALLAGMGVAELLLPALSRLSRTAAPDAFSDGGAGRPLLPGVFLGVVLVFGTVAALWTKGGFGGENSYLVALTPGERQAMAWVAAETPPESRFLLVTPDGWANDKASEWFPVLAERRSVATPQGYEWLPDRAFDRMVELHDLAHECGYRTTDCLASWEEEGGEAFAYVYLPKHPWGQCCSTLLDSLAADPGYGLVYDGPGATIYARR